MFLIVTKLILKFIKLLIFGVIINMFLISAKGYFQFLKNY